MSFIEWILNKLRNDKKEENAWEPEPLYIEDVYPDNEHPLKDKEEDDKKTVIVIDI